MIKTLRIFFLIKYYETCFTKSEQKVLEKFVLAEKYVIYLPSCDSSVLALYNKYIITAETMGGIIPGYTDLMEGDMRPFRIRVSVYKNISNKIS